ncbi:hypothetical protein E3226_007545 [Legionella geestiana]|uniref:type IV secretory system conjugative DNA transfer family protein n=1 Tax=Legionella geestiana TaxID=45065 RepID=UPI00109230ED|nr:type IV secretory system conjugative DNA transfer family protein [Legionella geestiana]QDQ40259.1 hypothetical protein E3226_007545 [Legionella geestiana]
MKWLFLVTGSLAVAELTGLITLWMLGLEPVPMPWDILTIAYHGFWREVIFSALIVCIPCSVIFGGLRGGIAWVISGYITGTLLALIGLFAVGFWVFLMLHHQTMPALQHWWTYLSILLESPDNAQSFLATEVITFALAFALFVFYLFERHRPQRKTLGDAHFANGYETWKAGFLTRENESLIIGKKYGVPLFSNGFEHVLVFAPTGSGKTRSIGIPNLFHYPYSVVCNDVKLTMFQATSGYREQVLGHRCYCWAPASDERQTHRYNPLSLISDDRFQRITDIQRIAHILMPDNKKSDPIWQQASRKLFKTVILYLLDTPDRPTTLGEINRVVKQPSFDTWLASILEETSHLDPEFYRNGYSYLNNHEKTRSSILETFSGYFELFDDPMVDLATSATDFDVRDLRREKMTIYIGFTDDDMERLSPLLTLFWQQLISAMIRKVPDVREEPYPLLCLIDEFSSLGRIERLRRSLKLLREYRVRCILMLQYIAQTYEQYTHDEARAFTNIKTKIAFAAEDIQDAEYVSKLLGARTVRVHSGSISNQHHGMSESKSYNYQSVPLMRPEKIMRMRDGCMLVMRTGFAPIKSGQYIWYKEKAMKDLRRGIITLPRHILSNARECSLDKTG